jgi:hypothetical protein
MTRIVQALFIAVGVLALVLAAGFFLQSAWATSLWPFATSRLSNIFLSSMLAAIGVPLIWLGASGDLAAARGGAADMAMTHGGIAAFTAQAWMSNPQNAGALNYAMFSGALLIVFIALLAWTSRLSFRDTRPTPPLVRWSFAIFSVGLLFFGAKLALVTPGAFPWPLTREQSVIYGWMFLGSAVIFGYGALRPLWSNAKTQLLGFLAYDLVLLGPFIFHFETVRPELWWNLVIYVVVLSYSAALAIYYLFVDRELRLRTGHLTATAAG